MSLARQSWTDLSDAQLLQQCAVDTYRASGPGGQKRNKTSSAVRLRHEASGLIVIAEESRSQHENRVRALKRMRQALYLKVRQPLAPEEQTPEAWAKRPDWGEIMGKHERLDLGRKDPRFWPAVGFALDVLDAAQARVSDAASILGLSTGNLVDFLQSEPKVWEHANIIRARHGQKPLK